MSIENTDADLFSPQGAVYLSRESDFCVSQRTGKCWRSREKTLYVLREDPTIMGQGGAVLIPFATTFTLCHSSWHALAAPLRPTARNWITQIHAIAVNRRNRGVRSRSSVL